MAMRTIRTLGYGALAITAVACAKDERVAVATAPPAGVAPAAMTPRAVALATTRGSAPIDVALAALRASAERQPDRVDPWILLGRAWVRKAREATVPGFYVNADACAEVALAIAPGDRLALDLRALVLLNDHRFEEARALAEKVVLQNAEDPMAYGNLSDALLELGRFDEAARAAQTMMDLKPNLPSYGRASYLRWLQGDTKGAKESARLAIDAGRDPRDPEPRAWMLVQAAMIFWHEGDYDGADAGFARALEAMPDYPPALVGRGRVAIAKGEGARASELLARALDRSPLVETAWLLGDAKSLAGDAAGAAEAYARAVKEGKRSDPRTLSLFESTRGEHADEALALAEAERSVRGDAYTDDALAWALYRKGRFVEARAAIDRALAHGTKDARLVYHQGAIRIAMGERASGRRRVAEALAMNPRFDVTGAAEATALLEQTAKGDAK
jgi:tetratricopeptide (TPR) repeat protein